MAIRAQQSVSEFIASEPQLGHTAKGDAWFCARIRVAVRPRAEDEFCASLGRDTGELGN
jgi:hypothetical protein